MEIDRYFLILIRDKLVLSLNDVRQHNDSYSKFRMKELSSIIEQLNNLIKSEEKRIKKILEVEQ